jgi:hypothetical protein
LHGIRKGRAEFQHFRANLSATVEVFVPIKFLVPAQMKSSARVLDKAPVGLLNHYEHVDCCVGCRANAFARSSPPENAQANQH